MAYNASLRLRDEFKNLSASPLNYVSAGPIGSIGNEEIFNWEAFFLGTDANQEHKLKIEFPKNYPNIPPKILFETKIDQS